MTRMIQAAKNGGLLLLLTAVILYRSCLRERYRGARGMTNLCMRPHGGATCP